jgi:hypothetical protein
MCRTKLSSSLKNEERMMKIDVRLSQRLELEFLPVQSSDSTSASIFPEVDALLEDIEYQKALEFVQRTKSKLGCRSKVDYLFCMVFPSHVARVKLFYDGKGKPLRDIISQPTVSRMEVILVQSLDQAHAAMRDERQVAWGHIRYAVSAHRW